MRTHFERVSPALARRLINAGCPLESWRDLQSDSVGLIIDQVGDVLLSTVQDLPCGGTGYMLNLAITNDLPRSVCIYDFQIELPWEDSQFRWLDDPSESIPPMNFYSFPGVPPIEFDRDLVINHRRRSKGTLGPCRCIEGLLLAVGTKPIPDRYRHGQLVEMSFSIINQREECFSSLVSLWVDRSAKLRRRPSKQRARLGLGVEETVGAGF